MLRRFLYACAALAAVLGLAVMMPNAALAAIAPSASSGTVNVASLSQGQGNHSFVHEPAFFIKSGHLSVETTSANNDIQNWSGYVDVACSTCHIRYVNANFKVPAVSCSNSTMGTDGANTAIWVGLDGLTDSTVEQIGIQEICASKTSAPAYIPFYEMYPKGPVTIPRTVKAGDSISISTYYNKSANIYSMTFNDSAQSAYTTPNLSCPSGSTCNNKNAEVIVENPGAGVPTLDLANFGSVALGNTTVTSYDGTHGDLCNGSLWSSYTEIMEDPNYNVMAVPGSLNTCSGPDGFTDYFKQSS